MIYDHIPGVKGWLLGRLRGFWGAALAAMAVVLLLVPVAAAAVAPGDLDRTFNGTGIVTVPALGQAGAGAGASWGAKALARQTDGKYVVGGTQDDSSGNALVTVARFNSDGSPDQSFGTGG